MSGIQHRESTLDDYATSTDEPDGDVDGYGINVAPAYSSNNDAAPPYVSDLGCWAGYGRQHHHRCLALTIITFLCFISMLSLHFSDFQGAKIAFYVITPIFYIWYLCECCRNGSYRYLKNVEDPFAMVDYHQRMRATSPNIHWTIQCWHYETRYRTVTDSNGNTHTESYQERVNTHFASYDYGLSGWEDRSNPEPGVTGHEISMVKYKKEYQWRDSTAKSMHDKQYARWINDNDLDAYKDVGWSFGIAGFKSRFVEVREGSDVPWWFNRCVYLMYSLVLMSFIFRVGMSSICGKRKELIVKVGW